ncbi:hypothetical protein YSY43_31320 [Paenibacillus sp. YSY-4.3]
MNFKHLYRLRGKAARAVVSCLLVMVLLVTSMPVFPGMEARKAQASTNLRIEPSEINIDKGEKTVISFSFSAADNGQTQHATKINLSTPSIIGGPPVLGELIASGVYPTKNAQGEYIVHEVEWDGKIGGVPLPEGRYYIAVSPADYDGRGVYYGQIGSFEIINSTQPKPPASITVEAGPSGSTTVKGTSETGSTVSVELRNPSGSLLQKHDNITVNRQGQWSQAITLNAGQRVQIAAQAHQGGMASSYSELQEAMRYSVPGFPVTWRALAAYYYKLDSEESVNAKIGEIAAWNGLQAASADASISGASSLLLVNPEISRPLAQSDLSQFTKEAIHKRLRIVNPSWSDHVEPARGDFAYATDELTLQALLPLSFGLTYLSRDPYAGAFGLGWHHSYEWRLVSIEGKQELMLPDGSRFEFVPLSGGAYLTPRGTDLTLQQNGSGHVLQTLRGTSYQFNASGLLTAIQDTNGNQIDLAYQGEQLQQVSTTGVSFSLAYDSSGKLASVTDHAGRALGFGYDAAGNMVSFTDVDGAVTKFTYDGSNHVISVTDPAQTAVMSVTYDEHQRVTGLTDYYGSTETANYSGKVAPVERGEEEDEGPTGPVAIDPQNGHDIPESDEVILSGTMHNLRNAPPYKIVPGLQPVITAYLSGLSAGITTKVDAFKASARNSSVSDVAAINQQIASSSGPVIIRAGYLNVEDSVTFGSSSKPVILIAEGINTNKEITVSIYGNLILEQGLNANTKLNLNAHKVGGEYGNVWAKGTIHLNNDSVVKVDDTLYAGNLTYNSGQLTVDAQTLIVQGNLSINTKVIMNIAKEMTLGGIVSNNQVADLTITGGDLFVRDNVNVNNQLSVTTGGVFAIGGDMTPNQTPTVRAGVGNGKTILIYPDNIVNTAPGLGTLSRAAAVNYSLAAVMPGVSATLQTSGETKRKDALDHETTYVWGDRFLLSEMQQPDGSLWKYDYDDANRLVAVTDGNGYRSKAAYDQQGNLVQTIDGSGASTVIRYNSLNRPVEVVDALGHATAYNYDAAGNLTGGKDALGQTWTTLRDSRGVPTQTTDERGETTYFTNDSAGFLQTIKDPAGYVMELSRDSLNRVTVTRDRDGIIGEVTYDAKDRAQAQADALRQTTEIAFDDNGNMLTFKDEAGSLTSYGYDVFRMTSMTDALGNRSVKTYDAVGNLVEETDANGGVTRYRYDGLGRIIESTDADGNSTSYTYDANGNLATYKDALGNTTRYTYNHLGQMLTMTDSLGAVTQYRYNANGQLTKETNALGNGTWYDYDKLGRLISQTDALGYTTKYKYDAAGNLVTTTRPNGTTLNTKFDARGYETGTIDSLLRETFLVRDGRGRMTEYKDAAGSITRYQYDALDRTTVVQNALGHSTTYSYNALGQVAEIVDANQQSTKFDYDALGQLIGVTDAAGNTTSYNYDAMGNLLTKTNALGAVTSYRYNQRGLVESTVNPLVETTAMTYDGNGNLKSVIASDGTTTNYSYDRVERLIGVTYSDGQQARYTYDLIGRRMTMEDGNGQTRYNYDALNRLTEVIDPRGQNIRYEWTVMGQRSRIIYPDNTSVNYTYDREGQINHLIDGQQQRTDYIFDAAGRVIKKTLPYGAESNYTYDAIGQLLAIEHRNRNGQLLEQLQYAYDPAGNIVRKERQEQGSDEDRPLGSAKPADIEDYTYDALNRLIQVQQMNGSTTQYSYDAAGNRLQKTQTVQGVPEIENYTYDLANKLIRWDKGTDYRDYTYDLRGNLLQVEGIDQAATSLRIGIRSLMMISGVADDVYGSTDLLAPDLFGGSASVLGVPGTAITRDALAPNNFASPSIPSFDFDPLANIAPDQMAVTDQVYGADLLFSASAAALAGPRVLETYGWDAANRLVSHINPSGDKTVYRYDGDDNRVYMGVTIGSGNIQDSYLLGHPAGPRIGWEPQYKKQQSEIYFTNDITTSLPQPLFATDASGTKWKQSYVYGAGEERISMSYLPSADTSNNWEPTPGASGAVGNTVPETLFYLDDALGSPLALLNRDGQVAARYHYDAFGIPVQPEKFDLNYPGPDNLFGYTGLGYDFNSGLSYARARYFDSGLGRFVSQDTYEGDIRNPLTLNLYTYVANNPLIYTDPTGHIMEGDQKYNSFVYSQLEFLGEAWQAAAGNKGMQAEIHATANYLRSMADGGYNYAIISLATFLPVDSGTAPVCVSCGFGNVFDATFLGDGSDREFGVNQLSVRTLQYGVVNLDYNSVVGFNYVGQTHQDNGRVGRASNSGMSWSEGNLARNGGSSYTSVGASASTGNPLVVGAPTIDYITNVKITGYRKVTVTTTTDLFPAYEGYISINGGVFNTLYQYDAVGGFGNLYNSRGKDSHSFTYRP